MGVIRWSRRWATESQDETDRATYPSIPAIRSGPSGSGWWSRARILPLVAALIVTQSVHVGANFAAVDGFYVPSDNHAFESVALFDSELTASAHWPCQSDAERLDGLGFGRSLGK